MNERQACAFCVGSIVLLVFTLFMLLYVDGYPSIKLMNILAISGSLRAASINSALLRATARLAPPGIGIQLYQGLSTLPLFNPDLDADAQPAVADFRRQILAADVVLIASPEYAHGITGVLKNALDWMVGNDSFVNKPVVLFNASPMSVHAHASLREIISVMSARIMEEASITVPLRGARLDEDGIVNRAEIAAAIQRALHAAQHALMAMRIAAADDAA